VKLENEFEVPVGVEQAWPVLLDVERITPCLPGAKLDEDRGDGEFAGQMKVKLGPITSTYSGTIKIEEADETEHRAVMRAQARDSRGQGSASATITSTMEAVGTGTKVRVVTDMRVTGPAARMGRGVMQEVSAKLLTQFAECLAAEISRPAGALEPAAGDARASGTGDAAASQAGQAALLTDAADAADAVLTPGPEVAVPPPPTADPEDAGAEPIPALAAPEEGQGSEDVLDLGAASRDAVLKRAAPVLVALLAVVVALVLRRRR